MLDELIETTRRDADRRPDSLTGTVATTIDADQRVMVIVRELQGQQTRVGPCPVMPRATFEGGRTWPVRGDRALVAVDQFGRPWVTCWEPA